MEHLLERWGKIQKKAQYDLKLTTPDVINNHKILKKLSELGCEKVIFEASSMDSIKEDFSN